MPLSTLADYRIDESRGFVPGTDPLTALPPELRDWDRLAGDLSAHLRSGSLIEALGDLPPFEVDLLTSEALRERGLLLLTILANACVWGGPEPRRTIPASVAVPLAALAGELDRPAIVHYGSMTLQNWRRVRADRPLCVENAEMQIMFLGGVDESWFYIASLGVELAGAPLVGLVHRCTDLSHDAGDDDLTACLERIAAGMPAVQRATARTYEWCDPHMFYTRIRPYVNGWPEEGVVYEGVSETPRRLIGGSAGQSSLLQMLDALLAVDHSAGPAGSYLRAVRNYMPLGHRAFVNDVERLSRVRARASVGSPALRAAYNAVLHEIAAFRKIHLRLAHDYVFVPSGMAAKERGTGGTEAMDFLDGARRETVEAMLQGTG